MLHLSEDWISALATFTDTQNDPTRILEHNAAFGELLSLYRSQIERLASTYCVMGNDPTETRKDLVSVGIIAFWTNLQRIPPSSERKFSVTMCNQNLSSQMLRHINQHARAVSTPEWLARLICKVLRHMNNDSTTLEAAIEAVASTQSPRARKSIAECLYFSTREQTIVSEGEDLERAVSPAVSSSPSNDAFSLMERLIDELPEKHAMAIRLYYGFLPYEAPHTFRDAGVVMNVSHERVRQLVNAANLKLRQKIKGTHQLHSIDEIFEQKEKTCA